MRKFLAVVAMGLCGCVSVGNEAILDEELVAEVKEGETTREEVRELLGKPQEVDFTDSGLEKWVYTYSLMKVRGASFVPIVGIFAGGADMEEDSVAILFDEEGVVKRVASSRTEGGGGSVMDGPKGKETEEEEADEWPTVDEK